jgi:hypothetical protein
MRVLVEWTENPLPPICLSPALQNPMAAAARMEDKANQRNDDRSYRDPPQEVHGEPHSEQHYCEYCEQNEVRQWGSSPALEQAVTRTKRPKRWRGICQCTPKCAKSWQLLPLLDLLTPVSGSVTPEEGRQKPGDISQR